MKSLTALSTLIALGIGSQAMAQAPEYPGEYNIDHAVGLPTVGNNTTTGIGTNNKNASGAAASATPGEGNTDESDDTLYHGKTSETSVTLSRDDGPLHFKRIPKEKIQQVDSLKKLQTSEADPKFQANLLHSSVTSIDDVIGKSDDAYRSADDVDPRFKPRQRVFTPEKDDKPQKIAADSTPSPSPSPTASASAQKSSGRNQ